MKKSLLLTAFAALVSVAALGVIAADSSKPVPAAAATYRSASGTTLKLMLDENNVGPEVTVGEIVFPPNLDSGEHRHESTEIFYVLSGELEHVVNGKSEILKAGMTGYVKPPDTVRHKTGAAGAKAVVIWVPGSEGKKIAARWTKEP